MDKLLAIDIGGTSVKLAISDSSGQISKKTNFPTPRENYSLMLSRLVSHIRQFYILEDIKGIAISSTGIVKEDRTIGWLTPLYDGFGFNLVSQLEKEFLKPVSVENDGNCAALAELWQGNAKNCNSLVMIVLGTSVGGAIIQDKKIIRGINYLGGEFGYFVQPNSEKKYEIWSLAGSTQALVKKAADLKKMDACEINGEKIIDLVINKESGIIDIFDEFIDMIACYVYNLQHTLDTEKILIGGGISDSQLVIESINDRLQEIGDSIPSNIVTPSVQACKFGNSANLIGAVYHWNQEYGESLNN